MPAALRLRDLLHRLVPWWMSDRVGKNAGFRFLYGLASVLDAEIDLLFQGMVASWPGVGTPTALEAIGRGRGLIRGQNESNEAYAARLVKWRETWRDAGAQLRVAMAIHEHLYPHPRVRYVNRHGKWYTVNEDGSVEVHDDVPFNWDSVSHPERENHWWNAWIIIYPPPWPRDLEVLGSSTELFDGNELGLGHDVTQLERDVIVGLVNQWKSDHTFIRAIIWSYDTALFDPENPASLPDGTWGAWGIEDSGVYRRSGRRRVDCRYWEPKA